MQKTDVRIDQGEEYQKEVKILYTGRQYVIQLPIKFIELLEIKKEDILVLTVPLKNKSKYSIKLKGK